MARENLDPPDDGECMTECTLEECARPVPYVGDDEYEMFVELTIEVEGNRLYVEGTAIARVSDGGGWPAVAPKQWWPVKLTDSETDSAMEQFNTEVGPEWDWRER